MKSIVCIYFPLVFFFLRKHNYSSWEVPCYPMSLVSHSLNHLAEKYFSLWLKAEGLGLPREICWFMLLHALCALTWPCYTSPESVSAPCLQQLPWWQALLNEGHENGPGCGGVRLLPLHLGPGLTHRIHFSLPLGKQKQKQKSTFVFWWCNSIWVSLQL